MDFSKYKSRFIDYANNQGMGFESGKDINCFLPEHGNVKKKTMSVYDEHCYCHKCGKSLDIYELAGFTNNTSDKAQQFKVVEEYCEGVKVNPKSKPKKTKPEYSIEVAENITAFMRQQAVDNFDKVLSFAEYRKYGKDFADCLGYWPGSKEAQKVFDYKTLEKVGLENFYSAGVVFKLQKGFKVMFVNGKGKTEKYVSRGGEPFGYPKFFNTDSVILVEAEISALAMGVFKLFAISAGGTKITSERHVEKLSKYKEITICFDADDPGRVGTPLVADKLIKGGYEGIIKIATLNIDGYDPDDYIKNNLIEELKSCIDNAVLYESETDEAEEAEEIKDILPFKFLGFSENNHYFLDRKDMITKIPAGKTTSPGILLEIAPLVFWSGIKCNKLGNPEWQYIADLVINMSNEKGPYKRSSIRGAGVWKEKNEIIASDGEFILCKKGRVPISEYESKNTYIRRADIGIDSIENTDHLKDLKSLEFMIKSLSFTSDQDGKLLFGWVISSLFLSIIQWRPIVYMKGPSQVGKSWVMNNIVRGILDKIGIFPNKNSTPVGIMQAPGCDSRMITVDEVEQDHNKRTQELITGLMTLARDTTTKSKEVRYVGTADQEGLNNDFSSMFLFASIVESSQEDQDKNRITSVNFYPKKQKDWAKIEAEIFYLFNNGFGERIRHNAIYHRESIVKNIFLFQKTAGSLSEKQRNGDQMGTLIAGWYHLEYPGKIATEQESIDYIKLFDFTEQNERGRGESYKNVLSSIFTYKIRYEEDVYMTDRNGNDITSIKMRDRTVFEILQHLDNIANNDKVDITTHELNKVLMNNGLRYGTRKNPNTLVIAQGHRKVKDMIPNDFSYRNNYQDYFKNIPGYVCKEKSVKFSGTVHPGIILEIDLSDDTDDMSDIPI